MVIYSKAFRDILISKGFKEYKEPEQNISNPYYKVFFFKDTPELQEELRKFKEARDVFNKDKSN